MIKHIDIDQLQPHPDNVKIYGAEDVTELAKDIEQSGWIKELVVTDFYGQYTIVSGHRRHKAAQHLGLDVLPCFVQSFTAEWEVMDRLLRENRTREKNGMQRLNEFEYWKKVEIKKSEARQKELAGTRPNTKDLPDNCPEGKKGESRDFAADQSGIGSGRNGERGLKAKKKMEEYRDAGEIEKAGLIEHEINAENYSGAERLIKELELLDREAARKAVEEAEKKANEKTAATKAVSSALKEQKRREAAEKAKKIEITHSLIDFRFGDFTDVLADIPNNSVDLILTDPPYPFEFIECWDKLGEFAARVLKPGAFCIAYSGKSHLPDVYARMGKYLDYYWTCNLLHTGSLSLEKGRNVITGWKPIIMWQNGFSKLSDTFKDTIIGTGTEKAHHQWQQSKNELDIFINHFTNPGDLIVEPFGGGGTTLIACAKMKRRVIGAEIDDQSFNVAKNRIHNELK